MVGQPLIKIDIEVEEIQDVGVKELVGQPLTKIDAEVEEIQDMISFTRFFEKLNNRRVS